MLAPYSLHALQDTMFADALYHALLKGTESSATSASSKMIKGAGASTDAPPSVSVGTESGKDETIEDDDDPPTMGWARVLMHMFDEDGDGFLNKAELRKAAEGFLEITEALGGANSDVVATQEEREVALQEIIDECTGFCVKREPAPGSSVTAPSPLPPSSAEGLHLLGLEQWLAAQVSVIAGPRADDESGQDEVSFEEGDDDDDEEEEESQASSSSSATPQPISNVQQQRTATPAAP